MNKRPLSVTVLGWLYIVTGVLGLARRVTEFKPQPAFPYDTVLVSLLSLAAIIGGVYLLRGMNWARWLAIAWIGFHVILSAFHSLSEFAIHCLICAAFVYLLTRPPVNQYFRTASAQPT
jgi:hypothetical protein